MKRIVVIQVLLVLAGGIAYPAFADSFSLTIGQPPPVVVQPPPVVVVQPQPVMVQPPPVMVQQPPVMVQQPPVMVQQPPVMVQQPPVVVQQSPVVYQPYVVTEGSVTISIDPEDYYYQTGGVYYHHYYQRDNDVVVETVPSGYRFVQNRIDIAKVPRMHFRHFEKTETTKDRGPLRHRRSGR